MHDVNQNSSTNQHSTFGTSHISPIVYANLTGIVSMSLLDSSIKLEKSTFPRPNPCERNYYSIHYRNRDTRRRMLQCKLKAITNIPPISHKH